MLNERSRTVRRAVHVAIGLVIIKYISIANYMLPYFTNMHIDLEYSVDPSRKII